MGELQSTRKQCWLHPPDGSGPAAVSLSQRARFAMLLTRNAHPGNHSHPMLSRKLRGGWSK